MKRLINKSKNKLRQIRHVRVRKNLVGTAEKPRLSVHRSLKSMTVQLIDDNSGKTLCYVSGKEAGKEKVENIGGKIAQGYVLGKKIAEKAKAKGITTAVFDRGGYKYHGRVKAVADGAREGGLNF